MDAQTILIVVFAILNVIAFAMYGSDKRKAIRDTHRTPEKALLTVSLFAPWGAIPGMNVFRHKTRKPKFKLVYLFAVIHVIIAAILILRPF